MTEQSAADREADFPVRIAANSGGRDRRKWAAGWDSAAEAGFAMVEPAGPTPRRIKQALAPIGKLREIGISCSSYRVGENPWSSPRPGARPNFSVWLFATNIRCHEIIAGCLADRNALSGGLLLSWADRALQAGKGVVL